MRLWLSHLLSNPNAHSDFLDWATGAISTLNSSLTAAVMSNEMEKARGIAHEIIVYSNLLSKLKAEARERSAQANFNDGR